MAVSRKRSLFILFLVSVLVSGCATSGEYLSMKNDLNQLKKSYYVHDKDIAVLKKDVEIVKGSSAKGVSPDSLTAFRESQEQLGSQVSSLAKDLQVLQGRFEENKFFGDKAMKDSALELDVIRSRLSKLEDDISVLKTRMADLQVSLAKNQEETAKGDSELPQDVQPGTESQQDAKSLYASSYDLFKKGEYSKAAESFSNFLKKYPGNELSDNSQFWLGECYFKEKNYEDAIIAYEKLIKGFPKSPKIPPALLKQAKSFEEIGDKNSAAVIYQTLVRKFSAASEAKIAAERLKTIKVKH